MKKFKAIIPYVGFGSIGILILLLCTGNLLTAQAQDSLLTAATEAATGETKSDWLKGIIDWAGTYLAVYYISEIALGTLITLINGWLLGNQKWFKNLDDLWKQVWSWVLPIVLVMAGWGFGWGFLADITAWAALLAGYRIGAQGNSIFKTIKSVKEILKKKKATV